MEMLTPNDISTVRFTTTRGLFHDWYHADEVDSFLESVAFTMRVLSDLLTRNGGSYQSMSSSDVEDAEFRYRGNWYRDDDVDIFLDRCADAIFCMGHICLSIRSCAVTDATMDMDRVA